MNDNTPKYLIIPAAGFGTRMKSVSPDLPKELLPVGNRPAIQLAVEEGLSAGIRNVIIIINRRKEIIRKYFEDDKVRGRLFPGIADEMNEIRQNMLFHFLYQKEPLGEADAVGYAEAIAGNHASAVVYPDNIYIPFPGILHMLTSAYQERGEDVIALSRVRDEHALGTSNSGRVDITRLDGDMYRIEKFIPKGGGHFERRFSGEMRATGIYICGPHIFEYIKKARVAVRGGEFTDTQVRSAILRDGTILGYAVPGIVYDIGNPEGYALCLRTVQKKQAGSDV